MDMPQETFVADSVNDILSGSKPFDDYIINLDGKLPTAGRVPEALQHHAGDVETERTTDSLMLAPRGFPAPLHPDPQSAAVPLGRLLCRPCSWPVRSSCARVSVRCHLRAFRPSLPRMSHSDQLRQLAFQLASLASLEGVSPPRHSVPPQFACGARCADLSR